VHSFNRVSVVIGRLIIGVAAFVEALAFPAGASPLADPGSAALASCAAAFGEASHDSPATGTLAASDILCINGKIRSGAGSELVEKVRALPPSSTVVIRSPGGEVEAAMELAEVLHAHDVTVIATDLCFSSCAVYLLAAGARRIVAPNTLLGFHGGVPQPDRKRLASELTATGSSDPAAIDRFHAYAMRTRERQDRLLASLGIAPDLFDWMDRFNALSSERQQELCPKEAIGWVLSPTLLARLGYGIDSHRGPNSAETLRQVLVARGRSSDMLCYVDEAALADWPIAAAGMAKPSL
jgi:hypothetical protein